MIDPLQDQEARLRSYAQSNGVVIVGRLGFGLHGTVWSTSRKSAIKAYTDERMYLRERNVYLRLRRNRIATVHDCAIPQLIDFDDRVQVVEMSIVSPPYVLDFAGAYLDNMPDYPADVMAQWVEEKSELFGKDWPKVVAIRAALAQFGIYYFDVSPRNICLDDDETKLTS